MKQHNQKAIKKHPRRPQGAAAEAGKAERKRAAAYCRVSTLSEMQDSSFETQRDAYLQLIAGRDDLVLAGVYGDHGKSGTSMKHRTEFQRMLRDCEAGKIDYIITKSISRFARNTLQCLQCIRHLQSCGVQLLFEKEHITRARPFPKCCSPSWRPSPRKKADPLARTSNGPWPGVLPRANTRLAIIRCWGMTRGNMASLFPTGTPGSCE